MTNETGFESLCDFSTHSARNWSNARRLASLVRASVRASDCWVRISSACVWILCSASSKRSASFLFASSIMAVAGREGPELIGDAFDQRVVGAYVGRDVGGQVPQLLGSHRGAGRFVRGGFRLSGGLLMHNYGRRVSGCLSAARMTGI